MPAVKISALFEEWKTGTNHSYVSMPQTVVGVNRIFQPLGFRQKTGIYYFKTARDNR